MVSEYYNDASAIPKSSDTVSTICSCADIPHSASFHCNENDQPTVELEKHRLSPSTNSECSMNGKLPSMSKRASQLIIEVPMAQLKRINQNEGVGSIKRETKHFSETTTMHGPKRIYYGKKWSLAFWVFAVAASSALLVVQVYNLIAMYLSRPTVSQVSFQVSDAGLEFPLITVCNFNPIREDFVTDLMADGNFTGQLLDYLLDSIMDTNTLYGNADRALLHLGDMEYRRYVTNHNNFSLNGFYMDGGFECKDMLTMCSFAGREFDCCRYAEPIVTNLGKCFTIDLLKSDIEWLKKQTTAGVNGGLQIVADAHLEQQFDGDDPDPIFFANALENGFRYYIHAHGTIPYLASEGISASPSSRVYSALQSNKYVLLSKDEWGNCTRTWPPGYTTQLAYSTSSCRSLCLAKFFFDNCGCSPFDYNIDNKYKTCTPLETYMCIDQKVRVKVNDSFIMKLPECMECKVECESHTYLAYNSYGNNFSNGALRWLMKKTKKSQEHIKENMAVINVFFRDMYHTEFSQIQSTSLTEVLSNIGGNMGMFLGMSLITITEIVLYCSKISWIMFSKKRRNYMFQKSHKEKEKEKQLEETVEQFKEMRTRKNASSEMTRTRALLRNLRDRASSRFSRKVHPEEIFTISDGKGDVMVT